MAAGTLEDPKWTGPLAKEYPFTLDPFQVCFICFLCPSAQIAGCTAVPTHALHVNLFYLFVSPDWVQLRVAMQGCCGKGSAVC